MMAPTRAMSLIDRLPPVRGEYKTSVPLADYTWFRVGGPAAVMFRPLDEADLVAFLEQRPADVPIFVIGVGSNILVRDGGFPGVVIRLGRAFSQIEINGTDVHVGAGAPDMGVALACAASSVAGLEFLRGIPGTVGGALRMNAGAFGHEIAEVVVWAKAIDPSGRRYLLKPAELGFAYRHCAVPGDRIFTGALLRGTAGERNEIFSRMDRVKADRLASQPVRARTGGSTFKNPPPDIAGDRKAWELIDQAGCRGITRGGAQVSQRHCNFLINHGDATATDLEALGEEVRRRVHEATGITLEWEIKILGVADKVNLNVASSNAGATP